MTSRLLLVLGLAASSSLACGPEVVRGSNEPGIDTAAMSTGLDKADIDQMVRECLADFGKASIMQEWRLAKPETWLVDAKVSVIDRRLQPQMIAEVEGQQSAVFNPANAVRYGRQLGAKFFVTGKLQANDERVEGKRRVQYSFFMQAIEVETSVIKWQHRAFVTKLIR